MSYILASIDEFGTNSIEIEKEGVSSHFLLCAILTNSNNLKRTKQVVASVRKNHFQGSEIKSSKVKRKSHARRMTILSELSKAEFLIYLLVVDKKEIRSKGLSIKHLSISTSIKPLSQTLTN